MVFEDEHMHCACGHQARDHRGELGRERECTRDGCECDGFDHSPEADQDAADDAWRSAS